MNKRTTGAPRRAEQQAREPAAGEAYARLVDMILNRELRPGERTSVNLLAERLGIGRTPVKEAITRLETEGVLSVVGRSGTTIKSLGADEARQLFELRRHLETFAAFDAAKNATPEAIKVLRSLLKEMRLASCGPRATDGARFIRANVAFHAGIIAAAGNPFLDRLYSQLQMQSQIATYLLRRGHDPQAADRRQREHEAILAALERRDGKALGRLLADHAAQTEAPILDQAAF